MVILWITIIFYSSPIYSQAILQADGPGNTYELINSVLAPGYDVVENPECAHPEFGRHIVEVFDADLNEYVFEFYIHVDEDNDRCINFDRQRMEIKTYDQSPDTLIGVVGETVVYKWKFKLPTGFQPSSNFTHIHQVKAVNGDDADPLFTLTARKGSPNKLELIHDNTTKVSIVDLSSFENTWVECTEIINVGSSGTYSLIIKKVSDGTVLLSYSNNSIMTIRADNDFIRPKWGIYRSLLSSADLRDEALRFNDFYISEDGSSLPLAPSELQAAYTTTTQIDLSWLDNSSNEEQFRIERSSDGATWSLLVTLGANITQYSDVGISATQSYYYRVRSENTAGNSNYTNTVYFLTGQVVSVQSNIWSLSETWSSNSVPSNIENVTIQTDNSVTIDNGNAICNNLNIDGTLQFAIDGTVAEITVNGDANVNGSFKCETRNPVGATNTFVNHSLVLYGDLSVSGVLDFRGGNNGDGTANGCEVTFAGSSNTNISLSRTTYGSSVEEFNAITVNKTGEAKVILASGNLFMSNNSSVGPSYLTFTDGMIETGSNIWATMVTSSSGVVGGSTTSYVNGNFGRGMVTSGGTGRVFEIGTSTGYRPIKIYSTTALASKSFVVASLIEGDADNSSTLSGGIDKVSELRYYELKAYVGADMSSADVDINELRPSYLDNDGVSSGNTDLRVAYSTDNRTNWVGIAQSSTHTTNPSTSPTTIQPDIISPVLSLDGTTTSINVTLANATGGVNSLPVELTSFSGSSVNNGVLLNWSTATEVNNYGFEIESSNDNEIWMVIGFVEGHGNSNSPKEYSFFDGSNRGITTKYRLKQIDFNGAFEYSEIIKFENSLGKTELFQNYPNPFNPSTKIFFSLMESGITSLIIYDVLGREISVLVNKNMNKGKYEFNFDAENLSSGIYYFQLKSKNFINTKKMILIE